ncbi:MAG TPA: SRPBCC domain-containing protein [Thermoleophilaceae bacterium]
MDAPAERLCVEREVEIAASPETVWELLTVPGEATRWMGRAATFDLRPGGAYRVAVLPGDVTSGEFVEIDPPRRLVYTWGWEREDSPVPPGTSTVEFELLPAGAGTLLRLRHHDLPGPEAAASHRRGWDHYLPRLAIAAAGGDPGPDPWVTDQNEETEELT